MYVRLDAHPAATAPPPSATRNTEWHRGVRARRVVGVALSGGNVAPEHLGNRPQIESLLAHRRVHLRPGIRGEAREKMCSTPGNPWPSLGAGLDCAGEDLLGVGGQAGKLHDGASIQRERNSGGSDRA